MPKTMNVESIPFHGLGGTVTILGDDFTPSTQPLPVALTDVPN